MLHLLCAPSRRHKDLRIQGFTGNLTFLYTEHKTLLCGTVFRELFSVYGKALRKVGGAAFKGAICLKEIHSMKKKFFGPKSLRCWSYFTKAGEGWEVGFHLQGRSIFVGNFVHQKEATQWYTMMNREISTFAKKYPVGPKFPVSFWRTFLSNHLHVTYYRHLDRLFARHTQVYRKAVVRDLRRYSHLKKTWVPSEKLPFFKAA